MMGGISYSCFTQFFPSPPTPVTCTCSAVADKGLKCTFWVRKRQFLAPVLDEAAAETSTLRASGSVHGAVGWNAFRLMTDFSFLFSPDLFLESSFLHGHISCVLETKMVCKKLLKSNCYWKKCLSSYNLHCFYSDEKPSFPSQAQPLMPSAGAWLVPKIFNGDIKTCRLSSRVEENKCVIWKKNYWRDWAEVTVADWKCYWILKLALCLHMLLRQMKQGLFYEVQEGFSLLPNFPYLFFLE